MTDEFELFDASIMRAFDALLRQQKSVSPKDIANYICGSLHPHIVQRAEKVLGTGKVPS